MAEEEKKLDVFAILRGPFKDIEFKDDFIIKFLDAGVSIGKALRNVPYPPVQVLGAAIDVHMEIARAIHRAILDIVQVNNAMIKNVALVADFGKFLNELQNVVLGRKILEKIEEEVGGGGEG